MSEFEFWKDIGNISDAILNYQKKNAEFNNRFINPWLRLGNLADREDGNVEIARAYQHATDIDPNNAQNWIDLGDVQLKKGAYEEAAIAYRKAVELTPFDGKPLSNLAFTLVMQGKYEEAIPLYLASIESFSDDKEKAVSWNHLGEAYRKLNNYEKAFLAFQKADELEGRSTSVSDQPQLLSSAASEEIPDETTMEQELEFDDEDDDDDDDENDNPLKNFEKLFARIDQPKVETSVINTAPGTEIPVKKNETVEETTVNRDEMLPSWLSEEHKSKLASFADETKSTRVPEWLIVNSTQTTGESIVSKENARGLADQLNGQKEANVEGQKTVIEEESILLVEDGTAKESSADVLGKQTNEMAYEEYLKDVIEPMNILSDHMDEIQNQAKLSKEGEALMAMETKNAQVWNELGNVYLKSGSYDDAIASYSKAIELERHFAWPYSNLALAYVQKGFLAEAILLYQRSIELFALDKDKAVTWNRLGNVYRRMNDYDNAIAAYETADELDPENATLSLRSSFGLLGNLYAEQKSNYVS